MRYRSLRPNDLLVAVYPKSGSTWVRFLLSYCLTGREVGWDELPAVAPYILGPRGAGVPLLPGGGRLVKTHDARMGDLGATPPLVLHLVRDGRDVAVSYFYQLRRQGLHEGTFASFLQRFLSGDLDNFGAWHRIVASWSVHGRSHPDRTALLRYEDLLLDASGALSAAMQQLRIHVGTDRLQEAIAAHSVPAMRDREKSARIVQGTVVDSSIPFVRAATSGGWRDMFDDALHARFLDVAGDAMHAAGYE